MDCAVIQDLLDQTAHGISGVLVLRGEAGIGKSALLDFAVQSAGDRTVLRGVCIESEASLPFASLHQVLYPILPRLQSLPEAQGSALRGALGLGDPLDRPTEIQPFAVALAVLTLLSEIAGDRGAICAIDDAQWLDQPSADALMFTARRLKAEGVVMLFAARDDDPRRFESRGLPEHHLAGLGTEAAGALLDEQHAGPAPEVRERLLQETMGNPLALLELTRMLTASQLSGREALPSPLPVGRDIEAVYAARLSRLPEPAQTLLRVAAAEGVGDAATVLRAAALLGATQSDLNVAESSGLIIADAGRLVFRHPLVRSATYQSATPAERRACHRAIAEVLTNEADADRRAWHRASATLGFDDDVAAELERSAARSRERGGLAASADALERSAQLSGDPRDDCRRLTMAAGDAWLAGQVQRANELLVRARRLATQPVDQGRIMHLQGAIQMRTGSLEEAYRLLLASAAAMADLDPLTALDTLLLASEAASLIGQPGLVSNVARLASVLDREGLAGDDGGAEAGRKITLLVGLGRLYEGDWVVGSQMLGAVVARGVQVQTAEQMAWSARAALPLGDLDGARAAALAAADVIRTAGAGALLPQVLDRLAWVDVFTGRLADAEAYAAEGLRLSDELVVDAGLALTALAVVSAYRGDEASCRNLAEQAYAMAVQRQSRMITASADWAIGLLELGLGRPEHALARLAAVASDSTGHAGILRWATSDLVEAAVRAGAPEATAVVMARLEHWTAASGLPASAATLARCRGLLSDPEEAEAYFRTALEHDARATRPLERARTELLLGENLRRRRQRSSARGHLRNSIETFERHGARVWADRARVELRATGETANRREQAPIAALTPQERQVAQFAGAGLSNSEIAGKLFLSRRTVEYHLAKVFTKLGLNSRQQLVGLS
jgi:DNA-binding CsgD family transcriptional regulator